MEYFLRQAVNGVVLGSIYALMALGLTLIFSILKVINFAHGEFYMLGGYFSYYLLASAGVPPILAVISALFMVFAIGAAFEFSFLRPMHTRSVDRPDEYAVLITFGLAFFLQNLALSVFGPFPKRPPSLLPGRFTVGFLSIGNDRLIASGLALLLMVTLLLIIHKTWMGRALRAVSQSKEAAAAVGINPFRMNTIAFGAGAALAAAAGALIAPIFSVVPDVGVAAAIRSYVIIVLGGMGSIKGAILGGLIIGGVESLGGAYFPDMTRAFAYKNAFGLLIFALILLLRPTGLFGQKQ